MTAGRIILDICNPALDANGQVMPYAQLNFYQNQTTTLQAVYSSPNLAIPLTNPLSADSAGRFVEMWADSTEAFSVIWTDQNGIQQAPTLDNIYSLVTGGADLTLSNLTDYDAARTNLGLDGVNGLSTFADGGTIPTTDAPVTFAEQVTFTDQPIGADGAFVGYLGIPMDTHNVSYTLVLTDRGRMMLHDTSTAHSFSVPAGIFGYGDCVAFGNHGTGLLTIERSAGVSLVITGTTTSADVSIGQNGMAVMQCINPTTNEFWIAGNVS